MGGRGAGSGSAHPGGQQHLVNTVHHAFREGDVAGDDTGCSGAAAQCDFRVRSLSARFSGSGEDGPAIGKSHPDRRPACRPDLLRKLVGRQRLSADDMLVQDIAQQLPVGVEPLPQLRRQGVERFVRRREDGVAPAPAKLLRQAGGVGQSGEGAEAATPLQRLGQRTVRGFDPAGGTVLQDPVRLGTAGPPAAAPTAAPMGPPTRAPATAPPMAPEAACSSVFEPQPARTSAPAASRPITRW